MADNIFFNSPLSTRVVSCICTSRFVREEMRKNAKTCVDTYVLKIDHLPQKIYSLLKNAISAFPISMITNHGSPGQRKSVYLTGENVSLENFASFLTENHHANNDTAATITTALSNYNRIDFTFPTLPSLDINARTSIMGILNVTPDSFSDGGQFFDTMQALSHAEKMIAEGADIIDIGGQSTRPGAGDVPVEEELKRVIPVIEKLSRKPVIISIDTTKAEVARRAVASGAHIINDISGLCFDPAMVKVVRETGVPVIIMHMQGTPETMQINPSYSDVIGEIYDFFRERILFCLENDVTLDNIIIDPGIGFGKTLMHNLEILNRLSEFKSLGRPILVGTSRKSFIGKLLDVAASKRIFGTAASVAYSVQNGAHMVRVHDVREMREVVQISEAIAGKEFISKGR